MGNVCFKGKRKGKMELSRNTRCVRTHLDLEERGAGGGASVSQEPQPFRDRDQLPQLSYVC